MGHVKGNGRPRPLTTFLFEVQKGLCFHCGEPMARHPYRKKSAPNGWTREHVIPRGNGGKDDNNVVLAHNKCNGARGIKPLSDSDLIRAYAIMADARTKHKANCRFGSP